MNGVQKGRLKMIRTGLVALLLVLIASAFSSFKATEPKPGEAGKNLLSGAEIQQLWASGAIIRGETDSGASFTIKHFPDGTAKIDWSTDLDNDSDTGTWRVKGGKSCKKWTTIRRGFEECWIIFKVGENKYKSFLEDELASEWSVVGKIKTKAQ